MRISRLPLSLSAWAVVSCVLALACGGGTDSGDATGSAGHSASGGGGRGGNGGAARSGTGGSTNADGCPTTEPANNSPCTPTTGNQGTRVGPGTAGVCTYNGYGNVCTCVDTGQLGGQYGGRGRRDAGSTNATWDCIDFDGGVRAGAGGFTGFGGFNFGAGGFSRPVGTGGATPMPGAGGTPATGAGGSGPSGSCPATATPNGDCTGYDGFFCGGCICSGGVWSSC